MKSRLSRREMMKLSGVALAGASIPSLAGCKGGGPAATSDTACLQHIPRKDVEVDIFGPASIGKVSLNNRIIRSATTINDNWTKALVYGNLIDRYTRIGKYDAAKDYMDRAFEVLEHIGETVEVCVYVYLNAQLQTSMGNLEAGEKEARRALEMAENYQMQRITGMAKSVLANNLKGQGRLDEAEKLYKEALQVQRDQRLERNRTLMHMGIIEMETGRKEGRQKLEAALAEFQEMGAEWDVDNARKALEG